MTKIEIQSLPDPMTMTPYGLVGEIIFLHPSLDRKKLLLETIYSQSVSKDNLDYWLEALIICQKEQFFPSQVISKINEVVRYIEDYHPDNPLLKKLCQSTNLPKRIVETACLKSKIRI